MKKFFYVAATALVLVSSANAAIMIDGYIDAGFSSIEGDSLRGPVQAATSVNGFRNGGAGGSGQPGTAFGNGLAAVPVTEPQAQFNVNEVNLDISADLSDRMRVFTSWDATDANSVGAGSLGAITAAGTAGVAPGGTGYSLVADYAYIEWAQPAGFDINIRLGMVPSVVGVEQRVAESNLTDFATMSLASPYTVGTVEGVTLSGTWSPINWAVQLSNDDVLGNYSVVSVTGAAGSSINDIQRPRNSNATTGSDNEHGRNIAARIGIVPLEGLEMGVSGWQSRMNGSPLGAAANGAGTARSDRSGFGGDIGYTYGALKLGAEYYRVKEDNPTSVGQNNVNTEDEVKAWYVYATYDVTDAVTLGARYTESDIDVQGALNPFDHDVNTISLLGKYNLTRDVAVKAQYDINDEQELSGPITPANPESSNDAFMFSVVASF